MGFGRPAAGIRLVRLGLGAQGGGPAFFLQPCVEHADGFAEVVGFGRQRAHRLAQFLHQVGILMRHPVHLSDGLVDLQQPAGLLGGRRGDFGHDSGDALHRLDDFLHGVARARGLFGSHGYPRGGVVDERLDLFGGLRAFERQIAHFAGHHGKAFPGLAGSCRFHGGVQGQDIGLEGDAFYQRDDIRNLVGAAAYAVHGVDDFRDDTAAALGDLHAFVGQAGGGAGIVRILLDGDGDFLHGGGGLLQRGRLAFGAGRKMGVVGIEDLSRVAGGVDAKLHIAADADQAFAHDVQVEVQVVDLGAAALRHFGGKIARRDLPRHARGVFQ